MSEKFFNLDSVKILMYQLGLNGLKRLWVNNEYLNESSRSKVDDLSEPL